MIMDFEQHRMSEINLTSILFLIGLLSGSRQYAYGLSCYVCHSDSASSSCLTNPGSASTCNYKYCTIYRRELAEPEGILTAFYRACEENPTYLNTEVSTPFAKTYYRACTSDRCNIGDGIAETTSNSVEMIVSGDSIVVPGIGAVNDALSIHTGTVCAFVFLIVSFALVIFYE